MSPTSSIENPTSPVDWFEGALIVNKENVHILPAREYSKVANLVKKYLVRNQKTPEDLFNCLNNKSLKRLIDYILLGFSLEHGIGTIPNLTKTFLEFQKAAEANNSFGQFFLGYYYNNGIGTSQDRGKAFELYSKAADAGNKNALSNLGNCYFYGWGTTKNVAKAFGLYSAAAEAGNTNALNNLALCYQNGWGTTKNYEKAFELYSKAVNNLALCYRNGWGTTKNEEKAFEIYSKAAEAGSLRGQINLRAYYPNGLGTAGNQYEQYNLGWCYQNGWGTTKNLEKALEIYLKAAEKNNLSYQSDFPDLNTFYLTLQDQNDLEPFFDKLSDEFKCLKCGNLAITIIGSPICPFSDIDKSDNVFEAGLSKCPECYRTLKDPLWCKSCELARLSNMRGTWNSGNNNIDYFINHTQNISESSRGCLEWISPDQITFLEKVVGAGGFGVVKEGSWERGKILFWDKKNQKYERSGVTRVALKCLKNTQNIEFVNSIEFIAHLDCAPCKYILECYGIIKDAITDEFIMVLPFAEHGDLRAFLKMNETTLTWEMFFRILFQIASGLRFIHYSNLVYGDLHPGNILVLKTNPLKVAIADLGFHSLGKLLVLFDT
ncbi:hypothetical protein G9A89_005110 [Geosiphon pyriformis]|nr:hypothetical protein G9A89_005110 [Geosiphon pyriformis]